MTIARLILSALLLTAATISLTAQTFVEKNATYPLAVDGNKYVVNGVVNFSDKSDETIFANALLWNIDNVCPQLREGVSDVNVTSHSFKIAMTMIVGGNTYYCNGTFKAQSGKFVYSLTDIRVESTVVAFKRIMTFEKLNPDKFANHKTMMEEFVGIESSALNQLFDFINTNEPEEITHWSDIGYCRPVEGMNCTECKLAFGKPKSIQTSDSEVQWSFSSSFYLFFKEGKLTTIIK